MKIEVRKLQNTDIEELSRIVAALQAANVGVFIIVFALIVALIPPAIMLLPAYSFEPIGFWAGMRKAFVYGFKTWGGIVAITFVVSLIVNVISGFLSVPYMLTAMAKAFLAMENSDGFSFVNSTWFSLISYLSALLYIYVCYVGYSVLLIAIAYQYGHACSALDIDNFDHFSVTICPIRERELLRGDQLPYVCGTLRTMSHGDIPFDMERA